MNTANGDNRGTLWGLFWTLLCLSVLWGTVASAQEDVEAEAPEAPQTMAQRSQAEDPLFRTTLLDNLSPLIWQADDCGCVPTQVPFVTYGFFPSWAQVGEEPVVLDFSLLARVGYYSLPPDAEGNFFENGPWLGRQFKETALRYESRVDLVISNHAWGDTGLQLNNPCVYKNLTDNIMRMLIESGAQGVTIDFSSVPKGMKEAYRLFVEQLAEQIQSAQTQYYLNLVIPYFDNGQEYFSKTELEALAARVDLFLVMADRPLLEGEVEQQRLVDLLTTYAKAKIRRRLVPVLDASSPGFVELYRFIVDNEFGGIGLWNVGQGQEKLLNQEELFRPQVEKMDYIKRLQYHYLPTLCKTVCPNRYLVRMGTIVLFGAYTLFLLLCLFFWEVDSLLRKYLLAFILLGFAILLIFLSLVLCVPQWSGMRTEITIAMILVVLGFFVKQHYDRKRQAGYP